VWLWAYEAGIPPNISLDIDESKMSGRFGDISNSGNVRNDMPKCNNTYRVYTFNYLPGFGTFYAFESGGHQMEVELNAVDANLFSIFQGP
jgi:hypothetical protein